MIEGISNKVPSINPGVFNINKSSYCSELQKVISVAKYNNAVIPNTYVLKLLNVTINEMISLGTWQKRELIYFAGFNSELNNYSSGTYNNKTDLSFFSYVNFSDPLKYYLTRVSNITNSPNIDKTGFNNLNGGNSSYYDTGWSQNIATKYSQNDASITTWANINGINIVPLGWSDTTALVKSFFVRSGTAISIAMNVSTATNTGTGGTWPNLNGHYHMQRTASNAYALYSNGTAIRSLTNASVSQKTSNTLKIGARTDTNTSVSFNSNNIFFCAVGSSFNSSLIIEEYKILNNLRTKLGYT